MNMKHINNYQAFKLYERKYEGVEVRTNRYERVHGKKPRGNGMWAFYFDAISGDPIFTPGTMNYTDAVKWASLKARQMGKSVIYVGESVNEAARVGSSSWSSILKDLSNLGWETNLPNATKYYTDDNDNERSLVINGQYGDNIKWTVYDERGKEINSGQFDAEGLSAGELDGEIWMEIEESVVNEREYSDEERKNLADKGLALPDGSFPIKDLEDLKNAIQAYGRSKDQSATAKFIVKRAKALSAEDLIPDTEDFQKALKETITEGNAFLAARARAIEEELEEFEFNGKKYPVLNRPKMVKEELKHKDAMAIIDAAASFSSDAHIAADQMWKDKEDLIDYLLSDHIAKKDHAKFLKSIK